MGAESAQSKMEIGRQGKAGDCRSEVEGLLVLLSE